MNSYSFEIIGSYWLFAILLISIIAITLYTYKTTIPAISNTKRNILMTLRIIGLSILLFLIFNPTLNIISSKDIEAKISYFIDNSSSVLGIVEENKSQVKDLLNNLDLNENSDLYKFDNEVLKINDRKTDSIDFKGTYTNLSEVFSKISSYSVNDNVNANVLITDGNFNTGRNPLIDLDYIDTPVFIIGVGDTTKIKDLSVYNILTNRIAYVKNAIPVEVNLEVFSIDTGKIDVILFENNISIDTIDINIFENQSNYNITFEYIPQSAGEKRITASASGNFEEDNLKNNQISEYVKVLDDKRNIVLFSGSPNSDLSFLVNELSNKENVKLTKYIQKNQGNFYNNPQVQEIIESQLIILQNFPNKYTSNDLISKINKELEKGKSLVYFFGPDVDINKLKLLADYLPFEVISHNPKEFQVQANLTENSLGESILRIDGTDESIWTDLPAIFKTETFVKLKSGSKMLLNLKMNSSILNEPMLISSEINNKKSIALMAYGLYRWRLLGYVKESAIGNIPEKDVYFELINNILKWVSIKDKEQQFVINTNKKEYSSGENVEFTAQLYDDSYNPLDEGEINIEIENGNEKRELILTSIGNGKYKSAISGLQSGNYNYKANAKYSNKVIGYQQGIFNIGDTPLEFLKTDLNEKLLKEIAEKSGGAYYHISEIKNIKDKIEEKVNLKSIPSFTKEDIVFREKYWILIIPIILFTIEWLIRKRSGLL